MFLYGGTKNCLHGNIAQLWIFCYTFQGGFWTFYSGIVSLNLLRSPHYSNFQGFGAGAGSRDQKPGGSETLRHPL